MYIDYKKGDNTLDRFALNAVSADSLSCGNVGSTIQPVYFLNGVPIKTTYTLEKSVPSDADFSNTGATNITLTGTGNILTSASYNAATRTITLTKGASVSNYTLPVATSTALGGVKTGYSTNGKNYAIKLDNSNNMYVNVPWTDNNTTYDVFGKATSTTAGTKGLVPAPAAGSQGKYLRGDGVWATPPNSTYTFSNSNATLAWDSAVTIATVGGTNITAKLPAKPDDTGATSVAFTGSGNMLVDASYNTSTRTITFTKSSVNNYTLPLAASNTRGGVKTGYTTNGKNYAVQLSSEKMYVNVPWTNSVTGITAGASGTTSNATTSNGNTYIKIKDDSTHRGQIKIVGSGATTVSSDNNGTITINSTQYDLSPYVSKTDTNDQSIASNLSIAGTISEGGTSLSNKYAPKQNYAGASTNGGAATSANKVNSSLSIKLNSGTTEGTNLFTFNGSAGKTVNITASAVGAAPVNHASTATTYGVGTANNYGHVKLSDATNSVESTTNGIAATPKAVNSVYNAAAIQGRDNTFTKVNTFTGSKVTFGVDDASVAGNIFLGQNNYGPNLPSNGTLGQLFFVEEETADLIGLPASTTSDAGSYLTVSSTTGNAIWSKVMAGANQSNTNYYLTAVTSGGKNFQYNNNVYINNNVMQGAAWNDYAEYRQQKQEIEPGYCVASSDNGEVYKTTEKFQACDGIVSDTFGFAIGQTEKSRTPLAVAGRVLAYCEGNRYDYHAGDTVCAGPEGKVCKMTREEIREWPDRIIGIVSEIPNYEIWGENNIKVNNRIWIKVK